MRCDSICPAEYPILFGCCAVQLSSAPGYTAARKHDVPAITSVNSRALCFRPQVPGQPPRPNPRQPAHGAPLVVQAKGNQYSVGGVSACTPMAVEACFHLLHAGSDGSLPVLERALEAVLQVDYSADQHLAVDQVLSRPQYAALRREDHLGRFVGSDAEAISQQVCLSGLARLLGRLLAVADAEGRSMSMVLVRPPETISVTTLAAGGGAGRRVAIFDSHPRAGLHPRAAAFLLFGAPADAARHLSQLWRVEAGALDGVEEEQARLMHTVEFTVLSWRAAGPSTPPRSAAAAPPAHRPLPPPLHSPVKVGGAPAADLLRRPTEVGSALPSRMEEGNEESGDDVIFVGETTGKDLLQTDGATAQGGGRWSDVQGDLRSRPRAKLSHELPPPAASQACGRLTSQLHALREQRVGQVNQGRLDAHSLHAEMDEDEESTESEAEEQALEGKRQGKLKARQGQSSRQRAKASTAEVETKGSAQAREEEARNKHVTAQEEEAANRALISALYQGDVERVESERASRQLAERLEAEDLERSRALAEAERMRQRVQAEAERQTREMVARRRTIAAQEEEAANSALIHELIQGDAERVENELASRQLAELLEAEDLERSRALAEAERMRQRAQDDAERQARDLEKCHEMLRENQFTCSICGDTLAIDDVSGRGSNCTCTGNERICRGCLLHWVQSKVGELKVPIMCPGGCEQPLVQEDIQNVSDDETWKR